MTAAARARFAELFAKYMIDINAGDRPAPTEAQLRKERVATYAERIGKGRDLYDGRPLPRANRVTLEKTDYDAAGKPVTPEGVKEAGRKRPGRPPKDDGRGPLTLDKLTAHQRRTLESAARRFAHLPTPPVPAWVAAERADDWRCLVRQTARTACR